MPRLALARPSVGATRTPQNLYLNLLAMCRQEVALGLARCNTEPQQCQYSSLEGMHIEGPR